MGSSLLRPFTGIALTTAREALRQPVFLLVGAGVVTFIAALPFLVTHILGEPVRMIRDSALAVQLVAGMLLGCQTASIAMAREFQKGTLSAVLSGPVDRLLFVAAKFAGLAAVMVMYSIITTIALVLAVRTIATGIQHDWLGSGPVFGAVLLALGYAGYRNFRAGKSFASSGCASLLFMMFAALVFSSMNRPAAGFGPAQPIDWSVLPVCGNITMAILLLTAMALTFSIRASLIPVIVLIASLLMGGLMSDYILGQRADDHAWAAILYGLVPNWQHFWTVDALQLGTMTWGYCGMVAIYTLVYIALAIAAGSWILERMEIKR